MLGSRGNIVRIGSQHAWPPKPRVWDKVYNPRLLVELGMYSKLYQSSYLSANSRVVIPCIISMVVVMGVGIPP